MPMPHRTFAQLAKRRLVGKEGKERIREVRALLAELPDYRNGPYADLRKSLLAEVEDTRVRARAVHRDSIAVPREGAAQVALVGPPNVQAERAPVRCAPPGNRRATGPRCRLRSRKAGTLLLLLIHARSRLVHREEAIEALWPDAEPDRASKHLNVALTTVRRGLDAVRPAGGRCVQRVGESYRLAPRTLDYLDVTDFEQLAEMAEEHEQRADLAAAVESADAALALADGGPYLAELPYEEWSVAERERLRTAALNLRTALAEWHLALGQPRQAVRRATEVVTSERWREAAWHVLIRGHRESGDRAAALQAVNECRRALQEELGVQPSETLEELAKTLAG